MAGCGIDKVEDHADQRAGKYMLSQSLRAFTHGNQGDGQDNHRQDCERAHQFSIERLLIHRGTL